MPPVWWGPRPWTWADGSPARRLNMPPTCWVRPAPSAATRRPRAFRVLGKLFLTDYLKGFVPKELSEAFAAQFPADYPSLVKEVYGSAAPARFLGSLAPFLLAHYTAYEYVKNLIDNNFRAFFERAIRQYDTLPLGITGGFAYACRDILPGIGREYGIPITTISASPVAGLLQYHGL